MATVPAQVADITLRPATPDRLPYLGRPDGVRGIVLATGHYRNGLVLTPVTAGIIVDVIDGRSPGLDLGPFRAGRTIANAQAGPSTKR